MCGFRAGRWVSVNNKGATRMVFLFPKIVVKIPRINDWKLFLCGLLGNMQERQFAKTGWPELCPIVASCPAGFWVVMRRCESLNDYWWQHFDYEEFIDGGDYVVPVENKRDSFGWLDDRIVALDYGS